MEQVKIEVEVCGDNATITSIKGLSGWSTYSRLDCASELLNGKYAHTQYCGKSIQVFDGIKKLYDIEIGKEYDTKTMNHVVSLLEEGIKRMRGIINRPEKKVIII
jgi:hypothetical protein